MSKPPLEWWESAQLDVLDALNAKHGLGLDVQAMRQDPALWRAFRERLRQAVAHARAEKR